MLHPLIAHYIAARLVDFVDIHPVTLNISVTALESKLKIAKIKGNLPKVLIAVHFSGLPCDMREIAKIYEFSVIEDASHAVGAQYDNEYIGSCRYSDITVFSFHLSKLSLAQKGGMALTNSVDLAKDEIAEKPRHYT